MFEKKLIKLFFDQIYICGNRTKGENQEDDFFQPEI